ncbi:MAG: glycosyltransferase family 2 protein [Anaerolineales bacterium]|nr:glycosyltransferase family 2 protein [Anaerolineales bacterium]
MMVDEPAAEPPAGDSHLSVIIPALNEETGIAGIVERVLAQYPALRAAGVPGLEVVVVDDGSHDQTAAVVERVAAAVQPGAGRVRLVRHGVNRGYGAALKTGLAQAQGDLIAFLDADGTYPPEFFPQLCAAALRGGDVVIGSRMSGEKSEMPPMRRVGNVIFAGLITLLGDQRVRDSASGMRVIRRAVLPKLYPLPNGLNFTPIMSMRAIHEGLALVEVPIPYRERVGRSKLSVVRDGLRYTQSILWTALGYNPVRILGTAGLAGVALAGLVGVGLVAMRLQGVTTVGAWGVAAIFAALVLGVGGVSLFGLGATFNYLVALLRGQPVRMGLFGKPIFDPPLDRHFGWLGLTIGMLGVILAGGALAVGLQGWPVERLSLYLVGSSLLMLVGLQLGISWVLMRALEELSEREIQAQHDLAGGQPLASQGKNGRQ